jgi:DNA-binding SARP family transcriptional activator
MNLCRTLGPVEISLHGNPAPAELLWRKPLALLVYLARSPAQTRSREHLVGLFWSDSTDSAARHSLNEALRVIRKSLGDLALSTSAQQVRLEPGAVTLDTEILVEKMKARDWAAAVPLLAGEFLEGFALPDAEEFQHWLDAERREWTHRSSETLTARSRELLGNGATAEAIELAERGLRLDRFAEPLIRVLLRALALDDNRTAALNRFEQFQRSIKDELSAEPEPETLALVERIRRVERRPRPVTVESAAMPPLIGRGETIHSILDQWESCRGKGAARLVMIRGEPGTGKSHLLDAVRAHFALDGAGIMAIRAVEADREQPGSVLAGVTGARAPGITAARDLVQPLKSRLEKEPLILIVDDAQWADGASLTGLGLLLRDLARRPLLVLVAACPEPARPELDSLQALLTGDVPGAIITLSPLSSADLRTLARWWFPQFGENDLERICRRVAADSAGIPLLASELFRAIAAGLDLANTPQAWPSPMQTLDQSLPGDLPDAIAASIRVRFRRLSPAAQQVIAYASLLDHRFDPELMGGLLEQPPADLVPALDELEWTRWLVSDDRGYSFTARIMRDVVARDMLIEGQRRRIRERIAARGSA